MVLTCFKSMTWVIENKSTASKVALINLKVCIALLNIFILECFFVFMMVVLQMKIHHV